MCVFVLFVVNEGGPLLPPRLPIEHLNFEFGSRELTIPKKATGSQKNAQIFEVKNNQPQHHFARLGSISMKF